MESVKFELTIKKFFEKAGVTLLKKGEDFTGGEENSSFMLLDVKRKSFYITETDTPDDTDFEINAVVEYFFADMPANVKAAILRLGRADSLADVPVPNFFSLDGLVRKSALIISEKYAPQVTTFLNAESIVHQSVPFKGAFMVYFIDRANSEKIVSVFATASKALRDHGKEDKAPDAAQVLEAISGDSMSDENLVENADEQQAGFSFDNLISSVTPDKPAQSEEWSGVDPNEADLLANIDLTKLIPPSDDEHPESQEEADLMYAKILNEQSAAQEVSLAGPRKHDISEIPHDIINETRQESVHDTNIDINDDERPEQAMLLKHDHPAEQKPKQTVRGGKGNIARIAAANVAGFVFFTPAYLLGKVLSKFFPPFVIYWLAAIAVIFGVYQYIWMIPGGMFYGALLNTESSQAMLLNISSQIADGGMAKSIIEFSGIMFAGLVKATEGFASGWLLRYLAAFGAVMMIFPYGRSFGARVTVFSLLSYFATPLMITAQSFAINSTTAMSMAQPDALPGAAAGIFASVFFIPIVVIIVLFIISGWLVPDGEKCENEVLP